MENSTSLIGLYTTNTSPPATTHTSPPNIIRATIRIRPPFRMFRTVFNELHEHSHTGIKITYNTFSQYHYIPFLKNDSLFSFMTVWNVNEITTLILKSKLLLHNPFQNMLPRSTTVSLWIRKDL